MRQQGRKAGGEKISVGFRKTVFIIIFLGSISSAWAGGVQTLDPVEVTGTTEDLAGASDSSTEGTVTQKQIEDRPIRRTGELLETVPGVVISQHSGEGKANQYYLRGFNLDHGTDIAITVDGMPVNMPTHAHGQGYSDLNFLIPELVGGVQYRKGPYYADEGDFSAAGAVHMDYRNFLEKDMASLSYGADGYRRALLAGSPALWGGHLLYGVELFHNDGPWDNPDDYRRFNGVLRYSRGDLQNSFSVTAMGYYGKWNATDQVAQRAIDSGLISRFGSLDPSDGGKSYRYSLIGEWQHTSENWVTKANAYISDYGLNLWSNFTYHLDHPEPPFGDGTGDQFEQYDRRVVSGLKISETWLTKVGSHDMDNTIGVQVRNDNIPKVALYHTQQRQILSTTRQDHVRETSYSVYLQNGFKWAEKFRTVAGVREDVFYWDVKSDNPLNSGQANKSITSPKLSMVFGPWAKTEYYLNGGYSFHSNDGRGSTIAVDPATGLPAEKVSPLVRAKGAEIGARTAILPHLQTELTFWILDIGSELIFTGDAGTTEASRPSRRKGIEWANYYTPTNWFTLDADFAISQSRFRDSDPAGDRIPGSPEGIVSAGATIDDLAGVLGAVRLRYFGPRPLIEDNSIRSKSASTIDARVGYKFYKNWRVVVDMLNVFNSKASDIDYYYTSRLVGEPPEGVNDIHTHPIEPREVRATLTATF